MPAQFIDGMVKVFFLKKISFEENVFCPSQALSPSVLAVGIMTRRVRPLPINPVCPQNCAFLLFPLPLYPLWGPL